MANHLAITSLLVLLFGGCCICAAEESPLPPATNIVNRLLERSRATAALQTNAYTYRKKSVTQELDEKEKVLKTTEKLYEVTLISGIPFNKLVRLQGRDLSGSELEKENEREAAFRQRVTRVDFQKKAKRREAMVTQDLVNRFDFKVAGRELINGRPTLVLKFTPKADAPDKTIEDKIYAHVSGTAWIDEAEAELTRLDATVQGPITLGWFGAIGSLKTFRATLDRVRMSDGVWLNSRNAFSVAARKLFSSMHFRTEEVSSDFRQN